MKTDENVSHKPKLTKPTKTETKLQKKKANYFLPQQVSRKNTGKKKRALSLTG
jgi:hypothetical protein